jgi:hypothetical protein
MRDFLTDLDHGFPSIFGVGLSAVRTLLICYYKLTFESLLEYSGGERFLLDGKFDSDSTGMRFCPDKSGIDKADLRKSEMDYDEIYLVETSQFL